MLDDTVTIWQFKLPFIWYVWVPSSRRQFNSKMETRHRPLEIIWSSHFNIHSYVYRKIKSSLDWCLQSSGRTATEPPAKFQSDLSSVGSGLCEILRLGVESDTEAGPLVLQSICCPDLVCAPNKNLISLRLDQMTSIFMWYVRPAKSHRDFSKIYRPHTVNKFVLLSLGQVLGIRTFISFWKFTDAR